MSQSLSSDFSVAYFANQKYDDIRRQCEKSGSLFEDTVFPAKSKSIFYLRSIPLRLTWKRPHEFVENPQFVVNEISRFDLDQGAVGNCWLIAALSAVASRPQLLKKIIPNNQDFSENYHGLFRFRFYHYGEWIEVVVDDKIPCLDNKPYFCYNRQEPNEMWPSLIEKAYAKLFGSYESLDAGQIMDGFIDLTGGVGDFLVLRQTRQKDIENDIEMALKYGSLIGTFILPSSYAARDERLTNGLVKGHAYIINKTVVVKKERLIRIRNPWGNEVEWNGKWSDNDDAWNDIPSEEQKKLGLIKEYDGEFWMSFRDFLYNFSQVEYVHIESEHLKSTFARGILGSRFKEDTVENLFKNPQFLLTVPEDCKSFYVTCMQQDSRERRRRLRTRESAEEFISIEAFRLTNENIKATRRKCLPKDVARLADRGLFINYREYVQHYYEEPGDYVIIPSRKTTIPEDIRFLVRVFVESEHEPVLIELSEMGAPETSDRKDYNFNDKLGEFSIGQVVDWLETLSPEYARLILSFVENMNIQCCGGYFKEILRILLQMLINKR